MEKNDELVISVSKIRYENAEDHYIVFQGTVMKLRPKLNRYDKTPETRIFSGQFINLGCGDILAVTVKPIETRLYGIRYQIVTFRKIAPAALPEIQKYLTRFPKVGTKTAAEICALYQMDTLDRLRTDPEALEPIRMPATVKKRIHEQLRDEPILEDMLSYLALNDIPASMAMPLIEKYHSTALHYLKSNPYAIYFDGLLDFEIAETLGHVSGIPLNSTERISSAIVACLKQDIEWNGNLFLEMEILWEKLKSFLGQISVVGFTHDEFMDTLLNMETKYQQVTIDHAEKETNIYMRENFLSELSICKHVKKLGSGLKTTSFDRADILAAIAKYEARTKLLLAKEQKMAVVKALRSRISILTGGPGTGKTQTVDAIIKVIKELEPQANIQLAAPTGRAALRMSELSGLPAKTIHRLLNMGNYGKMLQQDELKCDFLIVDEFSMVDCDLAAKLFRATSEEARVLIVGDFKQLPSVGAGLVLRDLIRSEKIPTTILTQIFRQKGTSLIVENAHAISNAPDGEVPKIAFSKKPGGDFYLVPRRMMSETRDMVLKSVKSIMKTRKIDLKDIKILCATNVGELGTITINNILQNAFNHNIHVYQTDSGIDLRVGDPVIQTRNNYDLGVFNGEVGTVEAIGYDDDKMVMVDFSNGRSVWYNIEQVEDLNLAYAITVHKAQGSEFKAVIIPVHESQAASKTILYTAITRAKQICVMVGSESAMNTSLARPTPERNSRLVERLCD